MAGGPLGAFNFPTPLGTPAWGSAWFVGYHDHLSYRGNYLSLDPNHTDMFGNPLLRLTDDIGPNEQKLSQYMVARSEEIARAMKPDSHAAFALPPRFDGGAG